MGGHAKRKRKVAVATINEEKENESDSSNPNPTNEPAYNNGPMYKIMSHVQTSEALHKKYVKDLQQLYTKMDHDAFVFTFIRMIKAAMACDEANEYAMTSLQFCAKFIASFDCEDTHPVLAGIFDWLLGTISNNPHIRFRLCQFINMILNALGVEAALDDKICDNILEYMTDRLLDISPNVRVQAILALQRLQVPDNPDDGVVRTYQFHLSADPSPRVRIAVISCMGRNVITVPYILDRLFDIDEKVRKHTYLQMSSYPVRSYKVSQRLLLLEQGLNDRCEAVRKVASRIMLQQWFESYKKDLLQLISALKLDATEADIERFRKVTKQTLLEIFKRENAEFLVELLPFDAEQLDFPRCIPFEKLQMEAALYWQCLSEFLQSQQSDEFDLVLPELSVFCAYTEKFCTHKKPEMDKFENLEFQYKLMPLLEILYKYDLGDETGRSNLKKLLEFLLKNVLMMDKNVEIVIRCAENVIPDQHERMQFLIEIISEICQLNQSQSNLWQDRTAVNAALANCTDSVLKMKLTGLKVKILDLEEQESNLLQDKKFQQAEEVTTEKNAVTEEFSNLLKPLLDQPLDIRKVKNEDILTGLQIIFHMIVSKKVRSLSSQESKLYKDFICRQMASTTTTIRIWALKCGTAFSMHFEQIAKEVFIELHSQFLKHCVERIWENSVKCIFEIIDFYGIDKFERTAYSQTASNVPGSNLNRRGGRMLYNTLENIDLDDGDHEVQQEDQQVGFIQLMSHFLDTLSNESLISEIVFGFIRLILHGHVNSSDIIEKLLLRYFNPTTNTKIQQYLGIFIEEMIRLKKQTLLVPSLLPTINAVLTAPYDSPLLEIRPETITRFFIDITRQNTHNQSLRHNHSNLHNKIAHAFLTEMTNNVNNREISKLLSKEILKLELNISSNPNLKHEMKQMTDKLLACDFDTKALKNLTDFKDMLDGRFTRAANAANESEEEADDETMTNENQPRTNNTTPAIEGTTTETTSNATTPVPSTIAEENESTLTETQATSVEANEETNEKAIAPTPDEQPVPTSTTVVSADESVASSQQSLTTTSSFSQPSLQQAAANTTATPTITTFGRQNKIGQRCLRRSLNNSCTHSESEASDVPRIRIEARIDSDKKRKPTDKAKSEIKKKNPQTTVVAAKALNSASSRSLRMLSRQQQKIKSSTATTMQSSNKDITTTTTEASSSEELNNSEVITRSPQATLNSTSRIFQTTRQRRGHAEAATTSQTSSNARQTRAQTIYSSPRKSPLKTPTNSPTIKSTAITTSDKTPTPTQQVLKKPSPKSNVRTPTRKTKQHSKNSNTPSPKNKTPLIKSPQQQLEALKTPSPKPKTPTPPIKTSNPQQASKTISPKNQTPTNTSKTLSTRASGAGSLPSPSSSTTKPTNRLPRRTIYQSATATIALQHSSRKRMLPRTPHPNKNITFTRSPSDSSSVSLKSPQRKQARRNPKSPRTQTANLTKRLTSKDIESLLNESSDSSSSTSSQPKQSTPIKKPTKPKETTAVKQTKPVKKKQNTDNRRKSSANELTSSNISSENTSSTQQIRSNRNTAKEIFRQQNIITRKRKSMQNSSSSAEPTSTTTPTQPLPVKLEQKRKNVGLSRIPVKNTQSSSSRATSVASSRSSSASPLRRGRPKKVDVTTAIGGFKKPTLRSNSLGLTRTSRIPRKLP